MRLDHPQADGKHMVLNFKFPDVNEEFVLELGNGVLNHSAGIQDPNADTTVTLDRTTLDAVTLGQVAMKDAVADGRVKVEGDKAKLGELFAMLDNFGFWFDIVTPVAVATQ